MMQEKNINSLWPQIRLSAAVPASVNAAYAEYPVYSSDRIFDGRNGVRYGQPVPSNGGVKGSTGRKWSKDRRELRPIEVLRMDTHELRTKSSPLHSRFCRPTPPTPLPAPPAARCVNARAPGAPVVPLLWVLRGARALQMTLGYGGVLGVLSLPKLYTEGIAPGHRRPNLNRKCRFCLRWPSSDLARASRRTRLRRLLAIPPRRFTRTYMHPLLVLGPCALATLTPQRTLAARHHLQTQTHHPPPARIITRQRRMVHTAKATFFGTGYEGGAEVVQYSIDKDDFGFLPPTPSAKERPRAAPYTPRLDLAHHILRRRSRADAIRRVRCCVGGGLC
ncbi:hypothetical protein B0H16DRAFT_1694737 [Mycena metata]|uniref:Uncharacterized protein n=1 Tax=Mycena metata TaxID=1033252 RepID=A0AAD7IC07_9AGAR|nr:hypothetical protein B0H16DRAFT_1694737 [Mycena metata]